MDISKQLIAPIRNKKTNFTNIDSFINNFLLFDHYIIDSNRLKEIPKLIDTFTFDGFICLANSGDISFSCIPLSTGSLGINSSFYKNKSELPRPLFTYSLVKFTSEPLETVNMHIQEILPQLHLSTTQARNFRKAIYTNLKYQKYDNVNSSVTSTLHEIISNSELVSFACSLAVEKQMNKEIDPESISINSKIISDYDIRVESNLTKLLNIQDIEAHKLMESAILSIAKRNDRIKQMEDFSCVSGFNEEDLPIFDKKVQFLIHNIDPRNKMNAMTRIIEIRSMPNHSIRPDTHIDANKLLKIKNSDECKCFRDWLYKTQEMDDKEIAEYGKDFTNIIGSFINSPSGKVIKFIFLNTIGLIPIVGQVAGLSLGALDEFLIEKIFPYEQPLCFIDELYPSIFDK